MPELRTVRVWCETCEGHGQCLHEWIEGPDEPGGDGHRVEEWGPCTDCGGKGWMYDAILIPLTGGPVVVEKEAWEAALAAMIGETRDELADEVVHKDYDSGLEITLGQEEANATFDYNGDILVKALTALFPAGIEMAEAVGKINVWDSETDNSVVITLDALDTGAEESELALIKEGDPIAPLQPISPTGHKLPVPDKEDKP